jgi:hypothetical protein
VTTYQARLAEFLKATGRLRTCAPTCPYPDGEHDEDPRSAEVFADPLPACDHTSVQCPRCGETRE